MAQGAAKAILAKTLPERSAHENWKIESDDNGEKAFLRELSEFQRWRLSKFMNPENENDDSDENEVKLKVVKKTD